MITHSAAKEIGKQKEQEVGWRLEIKGKWGDGWGGWKKFEKGGGVHNIRGVFIK